MTTQPNPTAAKAPLSVMLSREETLLITRLWKAESMLGLEEPSAEQRSPQNRELELLHAEHSLRARGLACLDASGNLLIAEDVFRTIGVCAYPERSLVVHHWNQQGQLMQAFGHQRDEQTVLHIQPQPAVHLFHPVDDVHTLIGALLRFCLCDALETASAPELHLEHSVLVQMRTLGEQANADAVHALLLAHHSPPASAAQLTELLASPHCATIIHALQTEGPKTAVGRALTLIHAAGKAWLATNEDEAGQHYRLQPTSTAHIHQLLYAAITTNIPSVLSA